MIPFSIGVVIILVAFAQIYVIENVAQGLCDGDDIGDLCQFSSAMKTMYDMFLDGISMSDMSETPAMFVISAVFGFIVTILLLNIVIAIVSSKWNQVYDLGALHYWRNRLGILAEVKGIESTFGCFCSVDVPRDPPHDVIVAHICRLLWPRSGKYIPSYFSHYCMPV